MFSITYLAGYLLSALSFKSESTLIVQFGWGCEMGTGCALGLCFWSYWDLAKGKFRFVWVLVEGRLIWLFFLLYFNALIQPNIWIAASFCEMDEKLCWSQLGPGCSQLCCLKRGWSTSFCKILVSQYSEFGSLKLTGEALSASCVVSGK